jgi:transcription elongation factor Elf1
MTDDNSPFRFKCPDCGLSMSLSAAREGRRVVCAGCGLASTALRPSETDNVDDLSTGITQHPGAVRKTDADRQSPSGYEDYDRLDDRYRRQLANEPPPQQEGNPAAGWVAFFLIFVVGNIILYATTGFLLIPR